MEEKEEVIEEKSPKKEIQKTITAQNNKKATEDEFLNILKSVAPGTSFRTALDGALKIGKGALIVIENDFLFPLLDGGFRVNCRFTPQRLAELTKMDGAIILSKDMKKINHANVLLTPDTKIKALETGTRHKAAERTAKQINGLVIAISERKKEISLFYKDIKYLLRNTDEIMRETSTYMQLLEKHKEMFDNYIQILDKLELKNYPSLNQAVHAIQKGKLIQKISTDLKKNIIETGKEGTILKARLRELILGVEKETNMIVRDYTKLDLKKSKILLDSLNYDELIDSSNILKSLAYDNMIKVRDIKGWRILSKTSLYDIEIINLIKNIGNLNKIINANPEQLKEVLEDEDKTILFKEEIDKIKTDI